MCLKNWDLNDPKKIDSCISVEKHNMCENLHFESNGIDYVSHFIHQGMFTLDPKSDVKFEVRILRDIGSNQIVVSKRSMSSIRGFIGKPRTMLRAYCVNNKKELGGMYTIFNVCSTFREH